MPYISLSNIFIFSGFLWSHVSKVYRIVGRIKIMINICLLPTLTEYWYGSWAQYFSKPDTRWFFYALVWYSIFRTCVRRLTQMFETCQSFKNVSFHDHICIPPSILHIRLTIDVIVFKIGEGLNHRSIPDSYKFFMVQKKPDVCRFL